MKYILQRPALRAFTILLAVLLLSNTGRATTAIMLSDEELIRSARVILLGDVVSTKAQWDLNHYNINTYVKVKVSKVIKGELQNEQIVFKQLGGTVGEDSTIIFGAPQYEAGQRVLLFLDTTHEGTLRVAQLFQGKYDVTSGARTGAARVERRVDKVTLLGATEGSEITNSSTLARFTKKIKQVMRAHAAEISALDQASDAVPIVETPPEYIDSDSADIRPQYTFLGSYRWFEPDTSQPVVYRVNPASSPIAGGGTSEINQAFAAWTNVTTTALVLQNGGSTTQFGFRQDGVSAISFNDPLDQMSDPVGCSGTLAIGGVTSAGGGTRVIGGITFSHIFEGDVVFNRNFACFLGISANLAEVATHEIGHSIGFGHSADTAATMYATAHGGGRGATLGSDDIAAVTFLYPGSKGTPPPPPPPPPAPVPPVAPSGLLASTASSSAINLTWIDGSNNEDGFRLQRRVGTTGTYTVIATLPAGQVTYSDTALSASTTYYYRILAFNGAGDSAFSNEAQATTSTAATADNAAFVSQSLPTSMTPGQSYSVTVTMRNTGTSTWSPSAGYRLGSQNPQDNLTWGLNRASLISSVIPGGSALIKFIVRAPATPGVYNFQWQMVKDGAGYFGGLSQNIAVQVGSGGGGGTDSASFVTQSAPASLNANQAATVFVTMRNSGSTVWTAGTYFLGSQNPQDNSMWGLNRVGLNSPVAPGSDATFTFNVTAPSTPGVYNFQWRMLQSSAGYFGSASTNVAITVNGTGGGGGGTNNAAFISQSVPASMNAGQNYTVSVTMRNSGTTTWTAGTYKLGSQNPVDNLTWGVNQLSLPASVAPGSDATFTFNVTAPSTAGTYNFQWRMLQSGVGYFGALTANLGVSVISSGPPTAPVTITTTLIANGTRGLPYSQQLNATGGTVPYSWVVTTGALPAGLSLDRNSGLISGTPVTVGTFNFTVTVTDRNGSSASKLFKTLVR